MIFKMLIEKYQNRYGISRIDLADNAETSRIHTIVVSTFLLVLGVGDLLVLSILNYHNLMDKLELIIYFGFLTLMSLFTLIYACCIKAVSRERSYIWKTFCCYVIMDSAFVAGVYNFYIMNQPFNGMIVFCISGFLSAIVFSMSPVLFSVGSAIAMAVMVPGIYNQFGVTALMDAVLCTILMDVTALYKRRIEKNRVMFLKKQKKSLYAKTFGNFTLMYEDNVVKFSRSKSEELIAYLISKQGSSAKTKELITVLWGDHADSARYGGNFRNLIIDIKHTFAELEIQNFFMAEYNNFRINPEVVHCDYYDFLAGERSAVKGFFGEFMSQYSWAEETAAFLEQKMVGGAVK